MTAAKLMIYALDPPFCHYSAVVIAFTWRIGPGPVNRTTNTAPEVPIQASAGAQEDQLLGMSRCVTVRNERAARIVSARTNRARI
jgi:hypothetical protein